MEVSVTLTIVCEVPELFKDHKETFKQVVVQQIANFAYNNKGIQAVNVYKVLDEVITVITEP